MGAELAYRAGISNDSVKGCSGAWDRRGSRTVVNSIERTADERTQNREELHFVFAHLVSLSTPDVNASRVRHALEWYPSVSGDESCLITGFAGYGKHPLTHLAGDRGAQGMPRRLVSGFEHHDRVFT